jgi:hypothetical protein
MRKFFLSFLFLTISLCLSAEEKNIPGFTGKVTGNKVRMRLQADLDSPIFTLLKKGEELSVVGEKNDFYAVKPPQGTKFYVFHRYIANNTVTGHRVNIRLLPSLDSPVVGRLQHNLSIETAPCQQNSRWLAIAPPPNVYFYVAKDYVVKTKVIYENLIAVNDKNQKKTVREALNSPSQHLKNLPEKVGQKPEKFSKLENEKSKQKTELDLEANQNMLQTIKLQNSKVSPDLNNSQATVDNNTLQKFYKTNQPISEHMKNWIPKEAELFSSWSTFHPEKTIEEFYQEQKASSLELKGVVISFFETIQNKPGDFLIRSDTLPQAYLYSTQINLQNYVGKEVTLKVTPRPNNNFAFPAFFVLEVF